MTANNPQASLIADFINLPHFIRFIGDTHGIKLSMPLLTKSQISTKPALEKACRDEGVMPEIYMESDGSESIGCLIKGETEVVISALEKITTKVFDVNPDDSVKYTLRGFSQNTTPGP